MIVAGDKLASNPRAKIGRNRLSRCPESRPEHSRPMACRLIASSLGILFRVGPPSSRISA